MERIVDASDDTADTVIGDHRSRAFAFLETHLELFRVDFTDGLFGSPGEEALSGAVLFLVVHEHVLRPDVDAAALRAVDDRSGHRATLVTILRIVFVVTSGERGTVGIHGRAIPSAITGEHGDVAVDDTVLFAEIDIPCGGDDRLIAPVFSAVIVRSIRIARGGFADGVDGLGGTHRGVDDGLDFGPGELVHEQIPSLFRGLAVELTAGDDGGIVLIIEARHIREEVLDIRVTRFVGSDLAPTIDEGTEFLVGAIPAEVVFVNTREEVIFEVSGGVRGVIRKVFLIVGIERGVVEDGLDEVVGEFAFGFGDDQLLRIDDTHVGTAEKFLSGVIGGVDVEVFVIVAFGVVATDGVEGVAIGEDRDGLVVAEVIQFKEGVAREVEFERIADAVGILHDFDGVFASV